MVTKQGEKYRVLNIAWGYRLGDQYALITTNISPSIDGEEIDAFFTSDIEEVWDAERGYKLLSFD